MNESDINFYLTDTVSLLEIDSNLKVDTRNNFVSNNQIKTLTTLPVSYNTLTYEISSSNVISFSSIPVATSALLKFNESYLNNLSSIDDGFINFTTDTSGIYTFEFENSNYHNLSSTTYSITAI
jgi:hypothetical protein